MDLPLLALFAQVRGRPPGPPPFVFFSIICCEFLLAAALLTVAVFHLITLYQAFSRVSPRNRTMEPAMIFLVFIPFFGFVWNFFIVMRLAESLREEFRDRGLRTSGESFGYGAGLTFAIAQCVCCFPVGIVAQIMHIMQIRKYLQHLDQRGRRREPDYEDED
jgi:hypothetical protein